tara:strand:+ start:149 stop:292 length:144 start_codon:yes stop_codon:yes gene_type:complete
MRNRDLFGEVKTIGCGGVVVWWLEEVNHNNDTLIGEWIMDSIIPIYI